LDLNFHREERKKRNRQEKEKEKKGRVNRERIAVGTMKTSSSALGAEKGNVQLKAVVKSHIAILGKTTTHWPVGEFVEGRGS